jgi:hypothetical protein
MTGDTAFVDRDRIDRAVAASRAPEWLRSVLRLVGERAAEIHSLPDDRSKLPEFIYRH